MRRLMWVLGGVVLGFVAAHFVNQTPEGQRFFDRVNRGVDEFGRAFATGYHDAESELQSAIDDVETRLQRLEQKQ
ncbi:MAG: hypothetical protein WDA07_04115 [Leucobacter sp.]